MKMTKTYELYIGSNNETGKLELAKLNEIVIKFYEYATINPNLTGIWKGGNEKTAMVLVKSSEENLAKFIDEIKLELRQEAVAFRETNELKIR